jgi:hypothetical protein
MLGDGAFRSVKRAVAQVGAPRSTKIRYCFMRFAVERTDAAITSMAAASSGDARFTCKAFGEKIRFIPERHTSSTPRHKKLGARVFRPGAAPIGNRPRSETSWAQVRGIRLSMSGRYHRRPSP